MTLAVWPTTIPQCPILSGFSEQRQRNVVSFDPDVGPPKMRRRSTAVAVLTSLAYRMSTDELTDFNTFFEDTLSDGTLPFSWRHPVNLNIYSWAFDTKEAPRIDRMTPNHHRITFNLLRLSLISLYVPPIPFALVGSDSIIYGIPVQPGDA